MEKKELIEKIQAIVSEWGSFNINEVEHEECPVLSCIGDHSVLIERVNQDDVDTSEYVGGLVTDEDSIEYENLTVEMLEEILRIAENHEVDCNKTWERSQS